MTNLMDKSKTKILEQQYKIDMWQIFSCPFDPLLVNPNNSRIWETGRNSSGHAPFLNKTINNLCLKEKLGLLHIVLESMEEYHLDEPDHC